MIKHKRRPDYWVYYHLGHCTETAFLIDMITNLVRENPCPHQEKSNRGRPPVHSRAKLDFICILMVAWHKTSRDMESDLSVIKIPWAGEPVPDHTTLARHLQTISQDWLDTILTKTATLCVAEAGSATGPLGADSSGVETTRYETVTRPLKSEKNFVEMARKASFYSTCSVPSRAGTILPPCDGIGRRAPSFSSRGHRISRMMSISVSFRCDCSASFAIS